MGVYIPGVAIPKEGCITLEISDDGSIWEKYRGDLDEKAIPVPPHGRLGGLDNLRKKLETICDRYDAGIISEVVCMNMMLQAVISAPTIIPAEESLRCDPCKPTQPECGACEWAEEAK